jgi:hypothetical protein
MWVIHTQDPLRLLCQVPYPSEEGTRSALAPDLQETHSTLRLMTASVAIPLAEMW